YDLEQIQQAIPADAALVAWADQKAPVAGADPNGDHWACLVRRQGLPVWVRLPGSGANGTWTSADDALPLRLRQALGQATTPLPGTRREVATIARLFPQADVLVGSAASEQKLAELARDGALKRYAALHFATHGEVDPTTAWRCALVLAQDALPDPLQQALAGR